MAIFIMPLYDFYIAGPMRGHHNFNFPAFDAARDWLTSEGYTVVSPADMDRQAGFDETANSLDGFDIVEAVVRDVLAIKDCEAIALLPGWEQSKGSLFEIALANFLGKDVVVIDTDKETIESVNIQFGG